MICPLCGKEHTSQYVIKVQEYYTKTDKINLVDAGVCKDCAMGIVGKIYVFANGTQVGENAELRAESKTCQWELEIGDGDVYHTSCGNAQIFICCNAEENNYKYCPYCGKPIKQAEPKSLFCTFDE